MWASILGLWSVIKKFFESKGSSAIASGDNHGNIWSANSGGGSINFNGSVDNSLKDLSDNFTAEHYELLDMLYKADPQCVKYGETLNGPVIAIGNVLLSKDRASDISDLVELGYLIKKADMFVATLKTKQYWHKKYGK